MFDAAARHLSFTRAADELAVTPAAVGQQIRALEDLLGVVLFRRTTKGLELTAEANAGLAPLREGFLEVEEAVRAMQAGQTSHVYTIAAPRDLFGLWLAPRLARFQSEAMGRGGQALRFAVVDDAADFTEANLDLAIRWAEGAGDLEGVMLGTAELVHVGRGAAIRWAGDMGAGDMGAGDLGAGDLESGDRALADAAHGALRVGDAGQALAAAAAGLGGALVPLLLAQAARDAGQLGALGAAQATPCAYWLVAPRPQWRQPKVRALVAHLTGG